MVVYDRVRQLAEERKMNISEVEKALGMGVNSLYAWKTKIPNGTSLEKTANYFHVTVDFLLGRENSEKNQTPEFYEIQRRANDLSKDEQQKLLLFMTLLFSEKE